MTQAARPMCFMRLAWVLGAAFVLAGCASSPPAQAQAAARRSNVAPPSIEMMASQVDVSRGASVVLTARTHGGEAMLFSVDWKVAEGAGGGRVAAGPRHDDGSYGATYTAPAASGTYYVTATIHEFPSAKATTEIRVR
jgi:hypothetical protein